jgi:ligand-binding sensor domain-containing protein
MIIISEAPAQQWTNYTPANTSSTLADNSVHAVVIDKDNVVWFGTEGGLSKYDGSNWEIYNSKNSGLTNDYINALYIDSLGNKWLGTNDGVFKFNDTDWIHYNISNSGLANNMVYSIAWGRGCYWFATFQGVSSFNGSNWSTFTTADGLAADMVYSVAIDKNDFLWCGTAGGGASSYDGIKWTTYNKLNGLADNGVNIIYVDFQNNIWFGTWKGVNKLTGSNFKTYNNLNSGLPENSIQTISQSNDGTMWFGTWNRGAACLRGSVWSAFLPETGLSHFRVYGIASDSINRHWFATAFGVSEYNDTLWKSHFTSGIIDADVRSMAVDSNGIKWFGTKRGVIAFNNINWTTFENSDNPLIPDTTVTGIIADADNNKWFTTDGKGLYRLQGVNWSNYTVANSGIKQNKLMGIGLDTSDHLWIGTYNNGVMEFDGNSWINHSKTTGMTDNFTTTVAINKYNHKWVGLEYKGADKFENNSWTNYNTLNSLIPNNKVVSFAFDFSGNVWMAAYQGGICYFDGVNWQSYTKVQGLVDNNVTSVGVDVNNNKWVGTAAGISMYNNAVWKSFTTIDGLLNDKINCLKTDKAGYIWFCTSAGISRYHPLIPGQGTITGNAIVCRNTSNHTFTVSPVKGATSYEWTLPAGATGSSNSNSIQVSFGSNAISGMISVKAKNIYGTGNPSGSYILVEKNKPGTAGVISGKTSVKKNSGLVGYTVDIIPDATSYLWSMPAGVTGTSNTNTIMLTFSSTAVSGYIGVKGHNECGDGAESKLYVAVTGIEDSYADDNIILNPNPFSDRVNILFDAHVENDAHIQLYDYTGRCILEKQLKEQENEISTSDILPGLYFARITNNKVVYSKLIVKQY